MTQIRRLISEDAAQYRTLMLEAFLDHPEAFLSDAAERATLPLAWWAARLEPGPAPTSFVLGAWDDDALRGVVGATFSDSAKTRHKATVFGLYVSGGLRGRGTARALMDALLDEMDRREYVRVVQLTVTEGNRAAVELYRSLGFESFGLEPMAMRLGSVWHTKLHLWCDLDVRARPDV